ncbi:ATP-dependent Clp protease proteolytic subunit [Rhizobium sp. YTU87027]|uniref:ATP-dependent Clp protease proteolytic subunit n=1 Tax=Rhizobium sp. YTU87027 TaxID=3417741 RepID=UPI003D68ECF4
MRLETAGQKLKDYVLSADDGTLMRHVFHALLTLAAIFVIIDWHEIGAASSDIPAFDPMMPDAMPMLPPALTLGKPQNAPAEIIADPKVLRKPIRFELQAGGVLLAQGTIEPGAAARFDAEIKARGEYVKTVSLDSPGGSIGDALAISTVIRERKIATTVASGALCVSSCPIIMAGGVVRTADKDAVIGVHQVFNGTGERLSPELAMSEAQRTTADVTRHLDEMGIKPGLWIHAMETPPDRLYYLSPDELKEFALVAPVVAAVKKAK